MYGKGLRPLSLITAVAVALTLAALVFFYGRRTTPTSASCRRSSTCTCRSRSSRCAASSPAA
jgi:hypothetical protein